MAANPDLPVAFVFNEQALAKLQLSSKRIYFYLETLQDLATRRDLSVYLGDPVEFAKANKVAVTHAPVPSFGKFQNPCRGPPIPMAKTPALRLCEVIQRLAGEPALNRNFIRNDCPQASDLNEEAQEVVKASWVSVRLEGLEPPTF